MAPAPMQNFDELSDFVEVIQAGPEMARAWLKDFDTKAIGITVKFQAKPEKRDDFIRCMKRHQKTTLAEEKDGVPHFKLHTSPFNDCIFYLVEEWASARALKKHFDAEYMSQLIGELKDILVPSSESQTYVSLYDLGFDTTPAEPKTKDNGKHLTEHPSQRRKTVDTRPAAMQNFDELSDFMEVIQVGPEMAPAWLKDFDTKAIGITVKFQAKPEKRDDFIRCMKRHQKTTLAEEKDGVPHFKLHTSPFNDCIFYLVEEWASARALKKHFDAEYMSQLIGELRDILVPSSESQTYVSLYDLGFDTTPAEPKTKDNGKHLTEHPSQRRKTVDTRPAAMQNFDELSDFMEVIQVGPEMAPAWLKDFDTKAIGITVKFQVKPEKRDDFIRCMKRHQKTTLAEEKDGVPHFKLHTSPFNDCIFYLVEEWASARALKKHFDAEYMSQLIGELKEILVPSSESQTYVSWYDLGFDTTAAEPKTKDNGKHLTEHPSQRRKTVDTRPAPMQNFDELSDFVEVIQAGPEMAPAWLKDFDTKAIGITVKFQAKPEKRDDFIRCMKRHQKTTLAEEKDGVPHFKLHTSPFNDCIFYLVEEWASARALKKHFDAEYMSQLIGELKDILVPSSESQTYVSLYDLGFDHSGRAFAAGGR